MVKIKFDKGFPPSGISNEGKLGQENLIKPRQITCLVPVVCHSKTIRINGKFYLFYCKISLKLIAHNYIQNHKHRESQIFAGVEFNDLAAH